MFGFNMPADQPIEKAAERRMAAEAMRKGRIFNTRLRVMGLDVDAISQQVQEKKNQQNRERQRDEMFDMMRRNHDEALLQQDRDERDRRAALHADLTRYWATHQRAEDSGDADLNFGLRGAPAITISEDELGPSCMQVFKGEGIGDEEKKREQTKVTERDLTAQKEDNKRRQMVQKHKEMLVAKEVVHQDLRWIQQNTEEEECKRAARIALDNYNRALAAERADQLREQHRREQSENHAEILHTVTSDMMSERPEAAVREEHKGRLLRVRTDRWRGMTEEQLSAIHKAREAQCIERQRQLDAEKMKNAAWEFQVLKASREAEEEARRAAELKREQRMLLDQYNMQLAREQKAHQEYLTKTEYTNKPTKDYFNQFNTSSR